MYCTGQRQGCIEKSTYIKEDSLYEQLLSLLARYELVPKLYDWAMDTFRDLAAQKAGE